ncbi:Gfo/Idh/MocA family protein [Vreelandella stevensii]|uniref:Gfo/Idh/MocA family protein n=1 Tax=Vreelandella stevensii TaxID=502821 RepID=UPI0002E4F201|nr:Gfo/Idh/MocA family oxidoreductase [Halomonas stevensii]
MQRFALIGAGFIGSLHARNLFRHPGVSLEVIADIDADKAVSLAKQYQTRPASIDEVFASDVDAVLIASSTATHAEYVERAANAGKAIYCEKPIDLSTQRAEQAVAAVREAKVPFMIGFNRRFDESHAALKEAMMAGEIGRVELVQMTCRSQATPPMEYIKTSGGQMHDQAIHFFDLLCWLTNDEPVEIHVFGGALSDPKIGQLGDVDTSIITLRMASGALAQIDCTRRTGYGYDERIELFGSEGMAESRRQPSRHLSVYRGKHERRDGLDDDWLARIETSFSIGLNAFVRGLEGEDVSYPNVTSALRAQAIADAAVRSLQIGERVAIAGLIT